MKLGTHTGSLVNHLHARATLGQPKPAVGMGATMLGWTDRYAGTITQVTELVSKRWQYEVEVVNDNSTVVSGSAHDGTAEYAFEPGTGKPTLYRSRREGGQWVQVRLNEQTGNFCQISGGGNGLRIGERDEYRDPSF